MSKNLYKTTSIFYQTWRKLDECVEMCIGYVIEDGLNKELHEYLAIEIAINLLHFNFLNRLETLAIQEIKM